MKKFLLWFAGISLIWIILALIFTDPKKIAQEKNIQKQEEIKDSILRIKKQKATTDSIAKVVFLEDLKFHKTKAGKIQKKHPDWTKEECQLVADKKIWIGMKYEMLIYQRGKPNRINTSNYGSGNEYQCCWDDFTPSCFYMKEDDIITAYN